MYNRFERFSLAISEISKCWHKLTGEEMERHDLKSAHAMYIFTLARYEEGLTAPQLCEICGKDKSDVSRMMRSMEATGIVTKDGGFQNRYGGVFRLTSEGMNIAECIRERANKAVEIAGADLAEEQRELFYSTLESIAGKLKELSKEGLPL